MTNTDELELDDYYNKEALKEGLRTSFANITFLKLDGTVREMLCTLMPEILTEYFGNMEIKEEHEDRETADNVLPVWDLEKNGWRTVRLDRIQSISFLPAVRLS